MNVDVSELQFKEVAKLVWLPEGEQPKPEYFAVGDDDKTMAPIYPNPNPWWELGEAVIFARELYGVHDQKRPWILVGDTLLAPDDVIRAYDHLKSAEQPTA